MTFRQKWLLRFTCIWTFIVWAVLIKNMVFSDHSFGFRFVHIVLAVISITLAALIWPLARIPRSEHRDYDEG